MAVELPCSQVRQWLETTRSGQDPSISPPPTHPQAADEYALHSFLMDLKKQEEFPTRQAVVKFLAAILRLWLQLEGWEVKSQMV